MRSLYTTLLFVPVFVLAVSVHEYAHAWLAVRRGDPTPRWEGRLTLDVRAHLSFVGTIMLLLFGIGWAKPVRVNPRNLQNPKTDMFWIALAGPVSNLGLAACFALLYHAGGPLLPWNTAGRFAADLLYVGVYLNVLLFYFNLLPVPPLDGSKILARFVPARWNYAMLVLEQYGVLVLFLLLLLLDLGNLLGTLTRLTLRIFGL